MPVRDNREYRSIELRAFQPEDAEERNFEVVGYATTWDDPYEMYEDAYGNKYFETISRGALNGANMKDVIFLYNHEGRVYARQSNGTLKIEEDDIGMKIWADLSSTEASRQMYEDIASGLITQMSWAFTISSDEYDKKTRTRTITRVNKVYDVSCVSTPANPSTTISARNYFGGVAEAEEAERLERERKLKMLELKLKLEDQ